jgi:hypothetical protein
MNTVEIRLPHNELSMQMGAMRVWLDAQGYESSGFSCNDAEDGVQIRLIFKAASEARAFAERFGGQATEVEGLVVRRGRRVPSGMIG